MSIIAEKLITVLVAITLLAILLFIGYSIYGYLAQSETLVIEVIDKRVEVSTALYCTAYNSNGICQSYLTTVIYQYIIVTPDERFSTSQTLYDRIRVGRRHHVVVRGWEGMQSISEVVE